MFDFPRTITITAYQRPTLFRQLLESLKANALRGWRVHIQIDPSPVSGEFVACAAELLIDCDYVVTVNKERLGVRENPFALVDRVFSQGSKVNIYLEEDFLVAPDMTNLALWYERNHQPSWLCLSLLGGSCGSSGLISATEHPDLLYCSKMFNSLGFVVLQNEWRNHFRDDWMSEDASMCNHRGDRASGWDWSIFHHLLRTKGLLSVQPVAARATHNGRDGGVHCTPHFHDLTFRDLPLLGSLPKNVVYKCLNASELPGAIRRQVLLGEQFCEALRALSERIGKDKRR